MRSRTMNRGRDVMGLGIEELEPRMCLTANGSLAFPPSSVTVDQQGAESVVAADFDRDGLNDLVSARGNVLSFFKGQADGTFASVVRTTLPTEVGQLAVGKFDGDQTPDVAALSRVRGVGAGTGYVGLLARVLYFDAGTGTFTVGARLRLGDASAATGARRIAVGDFVSGWRDEIVVGIGSKVDVRLLKLPMRTSLVQHDVLLRDDGAALLAMTVGRNLPGGATNGRPQVVSLIGETYSSTVALTRVTSDLVGAHETRGMASFATAVYGSMVVGDLDGDGDSDIVLGGSSRVNPDVTGEIVVLRASGVEFLAPERIASMGRLEYYQSGSMGVDGLADVNGDGRVDVLYHSIVHTDYRLVYTEFAPLVSIQNADGTFSAFGAGPSWSTGVYPMNPYLMLVPTTVGTLARPALVEFSDSGGLTVCVATTEKFGPILYGATTRYDNTPGGTPLRTGTASAEAIDTDPMRGGHVARIEMFIDLDGNGIDASDPLLCELTTQNPMYTISWTGTFTVPDSWAAGSYAMYVRAVDDDGLASMWTTRGFTVNPL